MQRYQFVGLRAAERSVAIHFIEAMAHNGALLCPRCRAPLSVLQSCGGPAMAVNDWSATLERTQLLLAVAEKDNCVSHTQRRALDRPKQPAHVHCVVRRPRCLR